MSQDHKHDYIGMLQKYQTLERKAWDGKGYHNIVLEHEILTIFCTSCGQFKQIALPEATQDD